jgi:hypothetical protein
MDIESEYLDKKGSYDKVAVGLEMDKQALEKECDTFQVITLLFIFFGVLIFFYNLLFCYDFALISILLGVVLQFEFYCDVYYRISP